jgi:hypothetical protein
MSKEATHKIGEIGQREQNKGRRKCRPSGFFRWSTWSTFGQHYAENNPHFPAFSRLDPKWWFSG